MIIKSAQLETVCGITSTLPENTLPEIAFAGKSNVGKSSLINTLLNRKKLARTSSSPGKTQTINFYRINRDFYLVDLPGYGYAKASAAAKEQWGKMIERYLGTSGALRAVFLLIDIRHEPGSNDIQMYHWIRERGFTPVIVATKADKLGRAQISRSVQVIRSVLDAGPDVLVVPFSAVTGQGKDEILIMMQEIAGCKEAQEEQEVQAALPGPGALEETDTMSDTAVDGENPPPPKKARWPKQERHKAARKKKKGRNGV